jgi:signal transduction histidine kinase
MSSSRMTSRSSERPTHNRAHVGYRQRVRHQAWRLVRRYALDVLLLAVLAGGVVETFVYDISPRPAALVLMALASLPLLLRDRYPLAAPLIVFGALITLALVAGGEDISSMAAPFFSLLLASWTAGAHPDRRSALIGLGGVLTTVAVVSAQLPDSFLGNLLWVGGIMSGAWIAAFAVSTRGREIEETRERAAQLAQEREERAREAVLEERARIARELHDVVAHSVSVMTVQAGAVRRLLLPGQQREREALETIETTGRQALNEMRRLLGILRQAEGADKDGPELAPQPGIDALDRLVRQVRRSGMPVDLRIEGHRYDVTPTVDIAVYRVVQEALTNALRHAGPAQAEVILRYAEDGLDLEVANDGKSNQNGDGSGHGLDGMRERVAFTGGTLEAGPREGGGFIVRAHIPLHSERTPA